MRLGLLHVHDALQWLRYLRLKAFLRQMAHKDRSSEHPLIQTLAQFRKAMPWYLILGSTLLKSLLRPGGL